MNPFTETHAESAAAWGESRLIAAIKKWLDDASPPPPHGIGDDCALFSTPGAEGLVTTDPVLWKRHFDEHVSPEDAAGKLFKRNLSDIAAMGGQPKLAVISLLLPPSTSQPWLERFHLGLSQASRRYGVPVAGGDVSQTDGLLGASMTLIGETTSGRALTRSGASDGDHLLVTGRLGGSRLSHHFSFEPRLREGQWLVSRQEVVAGMDISDGLAKDLFAMIPETCDAELLPEAIPVSTDAKTTAETSGHSPLYHALCDGEDHELLIAVKQATPLNLFLREWSRNSDLPLTRIGFLRKRPADSPAPSLRGLPHELNKGLHGYEHLR